MPSSKSCDAWPAMAERRQLARRARAALVLATTMLLAGVVAAWTPVALAVPGPGTECEAEAAPSGEDSSCPEDGGGLGLGLLIPLAGGVLLAGVVALAGAYLVLRRRAGPPLVPEPADAEAWWTCSNCGRNNVVGSARCYSCGAWRR